MRIFLLPMVLILASCSSPKEEAAVLKPGTYFGKGRNAACVIGDKSPQRFAFIAFASAGDANCAAEGRIEVTGGAYSFVPSGEGPCRIPVTVTGDKLAIGPAPAACSYYCGPGATLGGQSFAWRDTSDMLLAQQPLGHGGVC